MKAKTIPLDDKTIVIRRAEDIRYWRIYLLSKDGKILEQTGPWDNSGAQKALDEMIVRNQNDTSTTIR